LAAPRQQWGIDDVTRQPNHPSLLRTMLLLAASVIILAGMSAAAPMLNPILLGLFSAIIFSPVYSWLKRRGLATGLAMLVMFVGVGALFVLLGYLMARGVNSLRAGLATYGDQLSMQLAALESQVAANASNLLPSSETMTGHIGAILSALADVLGSVLISFVVLLFFLAEGEALFGRLRSSLAPDNPQVMRLATFGQAVVRYFGLRAIVNAITGAGFALVLMLLGVDYAALWGVLTFFLSYIPYLGIVLAGIPAVILAFAEYGLNRAILVVLALAVINLTAENLLAPVLVGRGLNISPAITFVAFFFWTWLLGGPGALLAMPLTVLIILLLDSFEETRWLASTMMPRAKPPPPELLAAGAADPVA
jgi:predicted PurR-regulated permease PerM